MCVIVVKRQKQRDGGQERKTDDRKREGERKSRAVAAFSRSLTVCGSASPPLRCDGLWEVMTHDNFYYSIQTQADAQQTRWRVAHSGGFDSTSPFISSLSFCIFSFYNSFLPCLHLFSLHSFMSYIAAFLPRLSLILQVDTHQERCTPRHMHHK